jgi:pyrroloquinoline quinone biosynthesis protein D
MRPRPSDALPCTDLGDEYLFYDREQDRVHVLNGTAREIFLLCDGSRSEEEIGREMADRYRLDVETALRDARDTIGRLVELGLLER